MARATSSRQHGARNARSTAKKFCPEGSQILLQTKKEKRDIYSRYIAEISFEGKNVSDYLLQKRVVMLWKE